MTGKARRRFDTALGFIGRTFITAGLLLLGLVVYQLWGTGFEQRRAQDRLREDFAQIIDNARLAVTSIETPTTAPTTSVPRVDVLRRPNSALALLEIPSAGVADIVVESATVSALRHGPGHITGTALPGEKGNSAIAGHRTTYGAPFADLDEVDLGDEIRVTTARGIFTYIVDDIRIVSPNRTDVLRPRGDSSLLTLVTCHPRFSTAKRLIVRAELATSLPLENAASTTQPPTTSTQTPTTTAAPVIVDDLVGSEPPELDDFDGWFSDDGAILPAILLGLVLAAIAMATHLGRRWLRARGRKPLASLLISWAIAALPFCVTLFYWYHFLNMLLPAST